ncbi:hypothetical protein [Acinetobacter sp. NIPH 2699]|uniref:J domain-containing protein n=1 Tax=Acinetobacter sp. NIPH 2699 TaxID=2923433 RepID=UPI001F4AFD84|nr:hypothetical protein [Acinetobacter sp. NIPH 2699]MCH7337629.1 hypothetical protein [Acinetobacter sp. NIPH 2699]
MSYTSFQDCMQNSMWFKQLIHDPQVYLAPHIPEQKLQGAASYLPVSVVLSDVLMLIDDTVFGSAKAGLCLTERGIYTKESFEDSNMFLFEYIKTINVSGGFFGYGLDVNGNRIMRFTQINKETAHHLNLGLRELLNTRQARSQSQQKQQSQSTSLSPAMTGVIDVMVFFALYRTSVCQPESRQYLAEQFQRFPQPAKQYLEQQLLSGICKPWTKIWQSVISWGTNMPYTAKAELMVQAFHLMAMNAYPLEEMMNFLYQLGDALGLTRQQIDELLREVFTSDNQQNNDHPEPESHSGMSIQHACQLLEIDQQQLSLDRVQHAYRKKMAEFHPDKYQQLPPSVRQLIEQQAMQLNQARDYLKDYLGVC